MTIVMMLRQVHATALNKRAARGSGAAKRPDQ
jgi:hypothetical protein